MSCNFDVTLIVPQYGRADLTALAIDSFVEHHGLDQFGLSGGREEHVSLSETLKLHEPVRHIIDEAALNCEQIVVDDGSPIAAVERLRSNSQIACTVLRLPRRRGVTAAWNAGARHASGSILVFLNNDTQTLGPWLADLIAPLSSERTRITGARWRKAPEVIRHAAVTRMLQGWCLAMTRETFDRLGGFDERFRLYFSDTDLQLRCLQLWPDSLAVVNGLPLAHAGKQTTRQQPDRLAMKSADRKRFHAKWNRSHS